MYNLNIPQLDLLTLIDTVDKYIMPELVPIVKHINTTYESYKNIVFEINGRTTRVYCTHPALAFLQPHVIDWVYKYNELHPFNYVARHMQMTEILTKQYDSYVNILPECASYKFPYPITVYKKVGKTTTSSTSYRTQPTIIQLELPANTQIIENVRDGKCRSPYAITRYPNLNPGQCYCSLYERTYIYPVLTNQTLYPRVPFDTALTSCSSGIHYFKTYKEANEYLV